MVQTGHAAAAVMAAAAATSDGERLPPAPLPLVMAFWGRKKKVFPLTFRAVAKCRGVIWRRDGFSFSLSFLSLLCFPISLLLQIIFPKKCLVVQKNLILRPVELKLRVL
jgi:hypothetical protein